MQRLCGPDVFCWCFICCTVVNTFIFIETQKYLVTATGHVNLQAPRRTTEASKSDAPAPTAYNPPQPPPLGPAWSFPNTQRDLEASEEDQQPAPGDYTALVRAH